MLRMLGSPRRCCDGITRRETLAAGALTSLGAGFSLPGLMAAEEATDAALAGSGKAKNVILLYLLGGAPTQDMYDLKPGAPENIRGPFQPIATSAPGVEISEMMPLSARWMHRSAIVRSVGHESGCHNTLPSYTGFERKLPNISITEDFYPPSMGSVCEYLNPDPASPDYIYMPCYLGWGQSIRRPGPYGGFLGKQYDPLYSVCSPHVDNPPDKPYHSQVLRGLPQIPNSKLTDGMTVDRLNLRKNLLDQLDDQRRRVGRSPATVSFGKQSERAWSILTSSAVRDAFDLEQVDPALRDSYGRTLFGSSALVARRLVESGVRFVNVTWDCYYERLKLQYECWDTHKRNEGILRGYNLPVLDATYNALMQDLQQSGLLDETLVLVMSDFGRTPKHNKNAGRDHWTYCYSVLFSGAGVRGGTVHGASDDHAAYIAADPVSTGDICASVYHCLGINPSMRVPDQLDRPVEIAHGGRPIQPILA